MNILHQGVISDVKFLQLCASITKGMTIYLGNFSLVPINSWWNLIKRRWNSEDRNVVSKYIDLRISKILSDLYADIPSSVGSEEIKSALVGLRELSLTYETDLNFILELSIIINKMEHFLRVKVGDKMEIKEIEKMDAESVDGKDGMETRREGMETRVEGEKNNLKGVEGGEVGEPKFNPTLINNSSVEFSPIIHTLKKIKTWSEMQNKSPPQLNSILSNIKRRSLDSLKLERENSKRENSNMDFS